MSDNSWLAEAVVDFLRGPLYINPLMGFIDQQCLIFTPEDENKLEYTPIHSEFKALVDTLITEFIGDLGVSTELFYEVMATEHESDKLTGFVVQTILTVDDFLLFKAMMVKRNIDLTNQVLAAVEAMKQVAGGDDLDINPDLTPEEEAKMLEEALQLSQILNANEEQAHRLRQLMRALQMEDEDIAMAIAIANSLRDQARMDGELAELNQAVALSMALAPEAERAAAAKSGGAKPFPARPAAAAGGAAPSPAQAPASAGAPPLDPLSPLNIGPNTAAERMAAVAAAAEASARALSAQVITGTRRPADAATGDATVAAGVAGLSLGGGGGSSAAAASPSALGALPAGVPGIRPLGQSRLGSDGVKLDGPLRPSEDVLSDPNQMMGSALRDLGRQGSKGNVRKAAGYKDEEKGGGGSDLASVRKAAQDAADTQRIMMNARKSGGDASAQAWLAEQKLKLVAQKKAEREAETAAYKAEQGGPRSVSQAPTQVRSDAEMEAKRAALRNKLAQKFKEDLVKQQS